MFGKKICKCKIYEDEKLLSLETLSNAELLSLLDSIDSFIRTWKHSSITYEVHAYESYSCFRFIEINIEIDCFISSRFSVGGLKRIAATKAIPSKYLQGKHLLSPKNTLCHKWSTKTEMELVFT